MPTIDFQTVLNQPRGEKRLLDRLKNDLENPSLDSFCIIVAFAKIGPLRRIQEHLRTWKQNEKTLEAIIGLDENGTSYEALKFALENFDKTLVVYGRKSFRSTFHPKQYIFYGRDKTILYVGSNNLTVGGTETNSESYIRLEDESDSEIRRQLDEQRTQIASVAMELDHELLERLKGSGLVFEEKILRKARIRSQLTFAETEKNPDLKPDFPVMSVRSSSRLPANTADDLIPGEYWKNYGEYLEDACAPNVNLYWNVGKKNNHLEQHLWAIKLLLENNAGQHTASVNDALLRRAAETEFPHQTMEGNRALIFSKLIGLIKKSSTFETTDAYETMLQEPNLSVRNSRVITQQIEKFYFWNDIFSRYNRHGGPGAHTRVSDEFRLYPIYFLYQIIIALAQKGFETDSLSRFEIEVLISTAKSHGDVDEVLARVEKYRNHESPEEVEGYLQDKAQNMDSRFYNILQYVRHFSFDSEIIALKPESKDEIKRKILRFNELLENGTLIQYSDEDSNTYRNMLTSSEDLLSFSRS